MRIERRYNNMKTRTQMLSHVASKSWQAVVGRPFDHLQVQSRVGVPPTYRHLLTILRYYLEWREQKRLLRW